MVIEGIDYNMIYKNITSIKMVMHYTWGNHHFAFIYKNIEYIAFSGVPREEVLRVVDILKGLKPNIEFDI